MVNWVQKWKKWLCLFEVLYISMPIWLELMSSLQLNLNALFQVQHAAGNTKPNMGSRDMAKTRNTHEQDTRPSETPKTKTEKEQWQIIKDKDTTKDQRPKTKDQRPKTKDQRHRQQTKGNETNRDQRQRQKHGLGLVEVGAGGVKS